MEKELAIKALVTIATLKEKDKNWLEDIDLVQLAEIIIALEFPELESWLQQQILINSIGYHPVWMKVAEIPDLIKLEKLYRLESKTMCPDCHEARPNPDYNRRIPGNWSPYKNHIINTCDKCCKTKWKCDEPIAIQRWCDPYITIGWYTN